jgi:restriction endonuclease S subunit
MVSWAQLGDLCQVTQGVSITRLRDDIGKETSVVQMRNLDKLEVTGEPDKMLLAQVKAGQFLKAGDVLVSLRGTPVRASVVTAHQADFVASSNLAVVSLKGTPRDLDPMYLAGLLRSRYMDRRFSPQTGGGKIPSFNLRTIRDLDIPVPSATKQAALAAAFLALENYEEVAHELVDLRTKQLESELLTQLNEKNGR